MTLSRKNIFSSGLAVLIALLISTQGFVVAVSSENSTKRADAFTAASVEFKVPKEVLLAVSYEASRWMPTDEVSNNNGYGLMNLRSKTISESPHAGHGRGETKTNDKHEDKSVVASRYSLDDAVKLLKVSPGQLKSDEKDNIRGAAASLAKYARDTNDGRLPSNLSGWYKAVALYSGPTTDQQAIRYANGIFTLINQGVSAQTKDGQNLTLQATPTTTDSSSVSTLNLATEAPAGTCTGAGAGLAPELKCQFVPAAYKQNSTPDDYGNYDNADRPTEMKINSIIIHDTEGSYGGTISWFQNSQSYVSAHYVISTTGEITEMVRPNDIAWTAGNWSTNSGSINIEHEGYAETGSTWYTDAMYQSSAKLVQYLSATYGVPMDREHIIGHDQVPTLKTSLMAGQHYDPGPFWNWNKYMNYMTAPVTPVSATSATKVVTILPTFDTNRPVITKCTRPKGCSLPKQGTSVVFLRTSPSATAPLLTDKYKRPNGSAGTTLISDWSATATSGRSYALAGTSGTSWMAIWFGSQKGWFNNADENGRKAVVGTGQTITPKPGITLYGFGAAYPTTNDFNIAQVPVAISEALYTLPADQSYQVMQQVQARYYYAPTIDTTTSSPRRVVTSSEEYYQISYNHRVVYVKVSDVVAN